MTDIARTCIKISLLGDQAVGKTCICSTFFGLEFMENTLCSIGIEKSETKMKLENGKEIKVKIWDTAGQERFKSISLSTIKNSQGVLVVFDVTSKESFDHVTQWLKKIRDQKEKIAIVLMGNKFDLPNRAVTKEAAEEFAQKNKLPYFESSAKLNQNIKEAFAKVVNEAYKISSNTEGKDLNNNGKKKSSGGGCFGKNKK